MCADWKKNYDPQVILEQIGKTARVNETGNLTITNFTFVAVHKPVISSAIEFREPIPEPDRDGIVVEAIRQAALKQDFSPQFLKVALSKGENKFLSQPKKDYILASALSFNQVPPFRSISIEEVKLILSKSLPRSLDRRPIERQLNRIYPTKLPDSYIALRCNTHGRSIHEAADKALSAIELLLGIWNSFITYHSTRLQIGMPQGPISRVRAGPIHTLHNADGSLATEMYWYEPTYAAPVTSRPLKVEWKELRDGDRRIRRRISTIKIGSILRTAFIRYTAALNEPRMEVAYLKLWGVLELLTDTTGKRYDTTVRRTAFLAKHWQMAKQELEHLRDARNRIVHYAEGGNKTETHVVQLKSYVDIMFDFLLKYPDAKASIEEIGEFLDSPYDKESVQRKIKLLEGVKEFREY